MGCIPSRQTNTLINIQINKNNQESIKITKGLFIQECKTNPYSKYDVLCILGEGSYGKVFKVQDKVTKDFRAMKLIKKGKKSINQEEEKKIFKEIEILKSLDHPNIIKVYEFFNTENEFFIISELCPGGELFDRIIRTKYLSEGVAAYVMKQLLSAVMSCHKGGIIHRDLKPENILIEDYSEKDKDLFNIQVIDFGTGEIFKDNAYLKKQIGTPYYIAPEVLNNKYNEKCDLWSCGVIMYILLCGCPPFYGKNDDEIFASVRNGSFTFSHKVWTEISDSAKDLIEKLLEVDIDKRLSAEKALKHKWFSYFIKNSENKTFETEDLNNLNINNNEKVNILKETLTNLKNFRAERKLQQATLYFMVHNMIPTQEKLKLREIFIKMDENMDGRLTKEEVMKGFKRSKMFKCSNKEIQTIMDSVDLDKNGYIEYQEFLTATVDVKKLLTEENLKKAFEMFDKDNSGNISSEEIQKVLGLDNVHSEQTWKKIVKEIDSDGDGEISFEEFKVMMHSLITSI